jgi:hypothetical protein
MMPPCFQSQAYRDSVEREVAAETKKKTELAKRKNQLNSQIDNLIVDSLALLKKRLDELGIQVRPVARGQFFLKKRLGSGNGNPGSSPARV